MARTERLSYDAWIAESAKRAKTKQEEETAYDVGRTKEQKAYKAWQRREAERPQRARSHEIAWQEQERNRQVRFEQEQDALQTAERERRLSSMAVPGHHWNYTNRMVAQDLADPAQAWKYGSGEAAALKTGYERAMAQPLTPRGTFTPGIMTPYSETARQAPTVRAARAAPGQRTIGPGVAGNMGLDMTERYGKKFLEPWGSNVLGFSSQMQPLQKLMGLTDDYYGLRDLPTTTQAARDYGASNLWDYAEQQRKSGDLSAIQESPNLQSFIKDRLGLQYGNVDDLIAGLGKYYGHVRQ